jgi:alpha-1,3/alpha-1,6-mannosyltransferase
VCNHGVLGVQNEHFGIVPLEAMAAARPVVACNSGGPVESVKDGHSGLLKDPTPAAFAAAMQQLLEEGVAAWLGAQARAHVQQGFSRQSFGDQLDSHYRALVARSSE